MNNPTHQPDSNCPTGRTAAAPNADTAQQHQQRQPCPDWLQTVWERFYVKYAAAAIRQDQEAIALSQLQQKIEERLKSVLTQEQYQLVLEWEEIMNQRHSIEVDRMYEIGVKVGIHIQREYSQFTQLPER
ncbi:hypothetical protein ACF3MZ_13365 [Paenibacillaceae bacterium WGS1546]|uniref:hypothetical protein n=1 Tax=Cohnella sp. WGS1546 TaxID=3366810 RepID=UPI00372D7E08